MLEINDSEIIVWFSCGAASAVAAKKTLEIYGPNNNVRIVNNPVIEEHDDNTRFLKDVEKWLGVEIEFAINEKYKSCSAVEVWEKRKYMSGVAGAPCTKELKKEARYQFEKNNSIDWHVLGFTADEIKRHKRFTESERANTIPVLIDLNITKQQCFEILKTAGIARPQIYELGYPNANCIGCVKATSPNYWNLVRRQHPEIFKHRAEQSRQIGCKLARYKGTRIFLDELPNDEKPKQLSMLDADFECGIWCEEI